MPPVSSRTTDQVGPLDQLALERAGVVEGGERPDRAQVGEQAEPLAQAEQALLGAGLVGVGGIPLRAADRRQQDGVGAPAGRRASRRSGRCRGRRSRRRRTRAPRTRDSAPTAFRTSTVGAMISGPIPSPGRRTTRGAMARGTLTDRPPIKRAGFEPRGRLPGLSIRRTRRLSSGANVTIAPSTPAQISVWRAPRAALTGPVSAYDSGSRPIEISQSRLDTRPSSCERDVALLGGRPGDRAGGLQRVEQRRSRASSPTARWTARSRPPPRSRPSR